MPDAFVLRDAGENLESIIRNPECVQPGHWGTPARLDHLQLSNDRIPVSRLRKPDYSIRYGEDGISLLLLRVLTEKEGSRFPCGQVKREALNESVHGERSIARRATRESADRSKRIDHDDSGFDALGLGNYSLEDPAQVLVHDLRAQVYELDGGPGQIGIEVAELPLISQHLERRLTENREIQRWPVNGCVREHYLVRQNRLSRTGPARDQIEGEFREPATKYRIEARDTAGKTANLRWLLFVHAFSRDLSRALSSPSDAASPRPMSFVAMSSPMSRPRSSTSRTSTDSKASAVAASPNAMIVAARPSMWGSERGCS